MWERVSFFLEKSEHFLEVLERLAAVEGRRRRSILALAQIESTTVYSGTFLGLPSILR